MFLRIQADPQLEKLRKEYNQPNETQQQVDEALQKWSNDVQGTGLPLCKITSYPVGWEIIHTICKFIDGTPVGAFSGDWKHLAATLEFDWLSIQKIENFATPNGVCLGILSDFALQRKGTLGSVLDALKSIDRLDILSSISSKLDGKLWVKCT